MLIEGHDTENELFVVHGVNDTPARVSLAEEAMIDYWILGGDYRRMPKK